MNKFLFLKISLMLIILLATGCTTESDTVSEIIQSVTAQTDRSTQAGGNNSTPVDIIAQYGCVPATNAYQIAQLVEVIDGDTIDVSMDGKTYRVRYIGINSPEYDEGQGQEATDFNASLVEGETLYLVKDVSETDTYGRLLRYVFTGKDFVNYEMVVGGYARKSDYEPDTTCSQTFAEAEESAKYASIGVWATSETGGATAAIEITGVNYQGSNGEYETDEYVEIQNTGSEDIDVSEWYIKDQGKHRFIFPAMMMKSGETCRVYTNEDHPDTCGLNFALADSAIWNNDGDCATLYDADGLLIDELCYP